MNTKGFTLVELLAVVIILSLLALITSTAVTKLVKDSKEELSDTQIELIKSAAQAWSADNLDKVPSSGECSYITLKDLKEYGLIDSKVIDANTNQEISDNLKIKITTTTNSSGNPVVNYEVNASDVSDCGHNLYKKYKNGEIVYFNVSTGNACKESEYHEDNSKTEYNGIYEGATSRKTTENQNGCLKFYVFNDSVDSKNLNLLLDHNTTPTVAWNSKGSNKNGPKEVLTQLKTDTSNWKGTETPKNYTMDQSTQSSGAKYTVDYSSYKARLITANEIAKITGNTNWNEATLSDDYYFDSLTTSASTTCNSGDTSGCKYGWLYDRTDTNCTRYGCLNNSDLETYGYWTVSSSASNSSYAWYIYYYGRVNDSGVYYVDYEDVHDDDFCGVRPVIEVQKSKFQ